MDPVRNVNNNTLFLNNQKDKKNKSNFKIYKNLSSNSNRESEFPYIPYNTIRDMLARNLVPFVQKAVTVLGNRQITVKDAETSCVFNFLALMVIFSGVKNAGQIKACLGSSCLQPITVILPEGHWTYYIYDLFIGKMIAASIKDFSNCANREKNIAKGRLQHLKSYENYIRPIMNKSCQVDGTQLSPAEVSANIISNVVLQLRLLKFEFNRAVIDALKTDMSTNSQKVNKQNSFIYYVAITIPVSFDQKMNASGSKDQTFYHALVIEQFQSQKGVVHRLYQSWQDTMTLSEYFDKQKYKTHEEGCLSLDGINDFLTCLNSIVSPKTRPEIIPALRERCFGTPSFGVPLPLFFDDKNNVLYGLSLRYFYNQVNPADTPKNYQEFLKEYL